MRVPRSDGLLPDRYVEIDLDWFRPGDAGSVEEFVERVAPLWSGNRSERGVVLNPGFLVDVVTEFSGDVDQELPLRSRRYGRWRRHSYADLRDLVGALKRSAARHGIDDVRVGILVAGVGRVITGSDIYDLESDWCDRHPELYPFDLSPLPGPDLDPRMPLMADDHSYAAFPDGIAAGTVFADVLAAQWAAVAEACDLDVIHLRDGFWGPMLYTRRGPYGVVASADFDENETWTTSVRDLFAAVKRARPEATVMAYTSGIGATAEWRSGCVDTEAVLLGGGVDILIDQTWGGAWQDWWDDWWKGWTNQHANLLSHGAAARGCGHPVRHYKLIETWDGWEPFDTVHAVPEKLRWAMWAWSHAAIVTPEGLEVPDGSYISWMNDRDLQLLDADAVAFVADELGLAEADANEMTAVGGPLVVFDHDRVADVHRNQPRENVGEHIEDAVALAMKWGLPALAATRAEWVADVATEHGAVSQLGGPLLTALPESSPVLLVGRADAIDEHQLALAGCRVDAPPRRSGYHREHLADADLPEHGWVHLSGDAGVTATDDADVLARAADRPTLVAAGHRAWWQPPELADPGNPLLPRSQYGSVASAAAVARWWATVPADVTVVPVDFHAPVVVHWWTCGDERRILVGNLETGWIGDARVPRSVSLHVTEPSGETTRYDLDIPREGCIVKRLSPLVGAAAAAT
jgi:hypothetical protein